MSGTDGLLELQHLDTTIDRAQARRAALESGAAIATARAEADAAERAFGELRLRIDEMARDQATFEHEIESLSLKEAAEQKRMYDGSIVNTKELDALQHELDNLKKRRSDREDELLALMEQREVLEASAAEAETAAAALRSALQTTSGDADAELVEVIAELDRSSARRAELAAALDPELLELYDDLRRQKKGVGAAALVDGVCQGCHEQLSSMELDKLKRTETIPRCEYCRRILVL
jgi:uncharacterized protein